MKERELLKRLKCSCCGRHIHHSGLPIFWVVNVERHGMNLTAVKRQVGLGMMLGSHALASVMGPDEDMTVTLMEPKEITFCDECALTTPIAIALECGESK